MLFSRAQRSYWGQGLRAHGGSEEHMLALSARSALPAASLPPTHDPVFQATGRSWRGQIEAFRCIFSMGQVTSWKTVVRENPQENESGNLGLDWPFERRASALSPGTDIFIFSCLLSNGGCLGFETSRKGDCTGFPWRAKTSSKKSTWCSRGAHLTSQYLRGRRIKSLGQPGLHNKTPSENKTKQGWYTRSPRHLMTNWQTSWKNAVLFHVQSLQ